MRAKALMKWNPLGLVEKEKAILLLLLFVYFLTRLYNLTLLPIFLDEAMHIRWSLDIWQGDTFLETLRSPLSVSKLLHMLLLSTVTPWARDLLWAGRIFSVFGGAVGLLCCYSIGKRLYDERAGIISACLYLASPFGLFYERMALADGLLCAGSAVVLWASIALVHQNLRRYRFILGITLGLTPLLKITGVLFFLTPLLVWLFLGQARKIRTFWSLFYLSYAYALCVLVPIYIFAYFLLGPQHFLELVFVMLVSPKHFNTAEFIFTRKQNFLEGAQWLSGYLTTPVMVMGLVGLVLASVKREKKALLLGALSLTFFCLLVLIAQIWFPRYLLFTVFPFFILTGATICHLALALSSLPFLRRISTTAIAAVAVILLSASALRIDYYLLTSPTLAPLLPVERAQYIEGWPSGYGVREAFQFFQKEAALSPRGITVVTTLVGGNSHFSLSLLVWREPKIDLHHLFVKGPSALSQLREWAAIKPTFVVYEYPPLGKFPDEWPDQEALGSIARLVGKYAKPGEKMSIVVYQVQPPSDCLESVPSNRWKGEYFDNKTLSGSPVRVRDDGVGFINFEWDGGSSDPGCGVGSDNFSVRWTRKIYFNSSTYHFTVTSDDGFRLFVDNRLVLDKWVDQPPTTYTADVPLLARNHTIKMEYYQATGQAVAALFWEKK
jgi:4-amino-4-deoxy-L-arabinose transferase-like glycosyltransferase